MNVRSGILDQFWDSAWFAGRTCTLSKCRCTMHVGTSKESVFVIIKPSMQGNYIPLHCAFNELVL